MLYNDSFRKVIVDKFKLDIKKTYLPDQKHINQLIASLNRVDTTDYTQYHDVFISGYEYFNEIGFLQSIKAFVEGCLNQLLWINTILESGKVASKEDELEEEFDYLTPYMLGNYWLLDKVNKKGVYFRGEEPYQDSQVIINSENIVEIALALSTVLEKNELVKSVVTSGSKAKESSLFKSIELQTKCLNVLKELTPPIIDAEGKFINDPRMLGAIVVWYHKCKALSFILNDFSNTRGAIAKEVMNIIPGLSIESSYFGKDPVAKNHKEDIEQKLTQISLK